MRRLTLSLALPLLALTCLPTLAAEKIATVATESFCMQCNRIDLNVYTDARVKGVACWMSRGVRGSWNFMAEDSSDATIACRQTGRIVDRQTDQPIDLKELKKFDGEDVFSQKTSMFWKSLSAKRYVDETNNSIVYLLVPGDLTKGSTKNSNSPVPVMPWPEATK